jgi:F-type H+-transporting ATPase subunit alpha
VGGKAQRAAYRAVAGDLKLAYAQFEELETFARFGARLDQSSQHVIAHGQRIRACLKQAEHSPVSVSAQILLLVALDAELFDEVPLERMPEAERAVREAAAGLPDEVRERFETADRLDDADRAVLLGLAEEVLEAFRSEAVQSPVGGAS